MGIQPSTRDIGKIVHDLRTPLVSVLGFSELMNQEWDSLPDEQKHEFVGIIERQARRLTELIDEVAATLGSPRAQP